jgi:hypothetical protein
MRLPIWWIGRIVPVGLIAITLLVLITHSDFRYAASEQNLAPFANLMKSIIGSRIDLPNGCVSGRSVSPKITTSFYPYDGSTVLQASPYDVFDVGAHDQFVPHEGRCPVKFTRDSGKPDAFGELPLADIGPVKEVVKNLDARALNNPTHMKEAEFPANLRAALGAVAPKFGLDPQSYEPVVAEIAANIAYCGRPEADVDLIVQRSVEAVKAGRKTLDPYWTCRGFEGPIGKKFPAKERDIRVVFGLIEKAKNRNTLLVTVEFAMRPDERLSDRQLSLGEAVLLYYERFGILTTYIDK